ncbi:MAG: cysteine--tRNA ligase [Lautropia sp.]|nr:cysteine--tRNA ligase [Lautropia sp.]
MLKLYNTLTRRKEIFEPLEAGKVGLYVCGMTVYDYCHIGHARMLVGFDVIQRWLRARGYQVTYVRNITDIDDKIIRRAVENGETLASLTGRFIEAMHEDEAALGIQRPDLEPRATAHVPQMLDLISKLEDNGFAYRADNGDMLFRVRRFPGYGRLGGKSLDDLRAGERVAVADAKEDPFDFVLWKAAKPEEPAEACWHSPFGDGRPGWHIECSAMSTQLLGQQFDIHGGGADLQFPHHENELAQSDGAYFPEGGKSFVRYWMHNGFVQVDGEKMSKSLGNFFTIRDVLADFDGEVIRYFIVRSHYRSQVNYSDAGLEDARESLTRLYNALSADAPALDAGSAGALQSGIDWADPRARRFAEAMDDDFNTPVAVSVLFELANALNRERSPGLERLYRGLASILGLLMQAPAEVRRSGLKGRAAGAGDLDDNAIEALVQARLEARRARRFDEADAIRQQLTEAGITLEDGPGGTTWRR